MIGKSLLAGALALACVTPANAQQAFRTTPTFVENPYIEKLSCNGGSGTGFKLADGTWVSANHVTTLGDCTVDGLPIQVVTYDVLKDYSTFIVPGDDRRGGLTPDCGGYRAGWYWGTGHALGMPILTSVPVMNSLLVVQDHPRNWTLLLYNRFIPGMSGGAVLNQAGEATGIVNAYAIFFPGSFSIALKDTPICQS